MRVSQVTLILSLVGLVGLARPSAAQPLLPPPAPASGNTASEAEPREAPSTDGVTGELDALEGSLADLARQLEAAQAAVPPSRDELEREAFEQLVATGAAPVLAHPTGALYPFGELVPELVCAPDRACDLELETGEIVDGVALGATDRWEVTQFFEGEPAALTPHILIKPSGFGLRTNLVVVTNRRTYHLDLASIDEKGKEKAFHHHIAFWYPQQWARRLRSEWQAPEPVEPPEPLALPFDPRDLDFGYRLEAPRKGKRRLPWSPRAVFDDGERIYVKLPAGARPLPAVIGRDPDGSAFPVNEHFQDGVFVIPSLIDELELVSGSGKSRRWLTIHRLTETGSP